ncbi:MAG TPA: M20/M25/M40 family metallo-hydrolase [Thermoanaerobaculia bacterium]|nr:M20/M25/M40 family metallo-hydrolase [Thermoanaerobaculia bacterium]
MNCESMIVSYAGAAMTRGDAGGRAVDLLHELVAIPSVTGSEGPVVDFLEKRFRSDSWLIEVTEVTPGRRNLLLRGRGTPRVVLTSHADTVPPYFEPRREGDTLFARGACDAKASLAAMAAALEEVSRDTDEAGLLVVVGEELGSDGALAANRRPPRGVQFLVGGEPTENRFVAGCKGCLRIAVETHGKAAHSSQAQAGASAVPPLLDVLSALRDLDVPSDTLFGGTSMNIGVLRAGVAPNVLADRGRAEILFRTGRPVEELLERVSKAAGGAATVDVAYRSDPIHFRLPRGAAGEVVSFACDLPLLKDWGEPLLIGPGAIVDAHAAEEKVRLSEVERAVTLYADLVRGLLARGEDYLQPARPR